MRARTRTRTTPQPATTSPSWELACTCRPGPYILAHFRKEQLISVTRMHNRLTPSGTPSRCPIAREPIDPEVWYAGR